MPTAKPTLKVPPAGPLPTASAPSYRKATPRRKASGATTNKKGKSKPSATSLPSSTALFSDEGSEAMRPTGGGAAASSSSSFSSPPSPEDLVHSQSLLDPTTGEVDDNKIRTRYPSSSRDDDAVLSGAESAASDASERSARETYANSEGFAARLARARLDRQRERRRASAGGGGGSSNPNHHAADGGDGSSSCSSSDRTTTSNTNSAHSTSRAANLQVELDRMRAERAARTAKLLASLDELSKSSGASLLSALVPVHNQETALTAVSRTDPQTGGAIVSSSSTALVTANPSEIEEYTGLAEDSYTTEARSILRMLRSKESRRKLRQWLSEEGRAARVRAVIEAAPEPLRQALVDVLLRLLSEEEEMDESMLMQPLLIRGPGGGDDEVEEVEDDEEDAPMQIMLISPFNASTRIEEI